MEKSESKQKSEKEKKIKSRKSKKNLQPEEEKKVEEEKDKTDDADLLVPISMSTGVDFQTYEATPEEIEAKEKVIEDRMEAEYKLSRSGVVCSGKNNGELMLIAAFHGFIDVIKFFETSHYPITYQNDFGDSLLH